MKVVNPLSESAWFPFIMTFVITWPIFYIIEILIPHTEENMRYERECAAKGGFLYEQQNEERKCIKKDYLIIPL